MDMQDRRAGSVGYLVNWAARLFVRALDRRLSAGNLGPMPVYYALLDGGALPQKELAQFAAVEQPTMANTLARMQRDGLIAGEPDPADGRSTLLTLTREGRDRGRRALDMATALNDFALEALTADERPVFLDMLQRIISRLEADA